MNDNGNCVLIILLSKQSKHTISNKGHRDDSIVLIQEEPDKNSISFIYNNDHNRNCDHTVRNSNNCDSDYCVLILNNYDDKSIIVILVLILLSKLDEHSDDEIILIILSKLLKCNDNDNVSVLFLLLKGINKRSNYNDAGFRIAQSLSEITIKHQDGTSISNVLSQCCKEERVDEHSIDSYINKRVLSNLVSNCTDDECTWNLMIQNTINNESSIKIDAHGKDDATNDNLSVLLILKRISKRKHDLLNLTMLITLLLKRTSNRKERKNIDAFTLHVLLKSINDNSGIHFDNSDDGTSSYYLSIYINEKVSTGNDNDKEDNCDRTVQMNRDNTYTDCEVVYSINDSTTGCIVILVLRRTNSINNNGDDCNNCIHIIDYNDNNDHDRNARAICNDIEKKAILYRITSTNNDNNDCINTTHLVLNDSLSQMTIFGVMH